ncbi:MAG: putative Zn finger-like uncharacterized protein [Paracoccaceae bacterium]|jgi:predicted Zn finger-like uncharacterized protein
MRLICPECGAQYAVEDGLIPASGRDVQCSNCQANWFEKPDATEAPHQQAETGQTGATATDTIAPPRRPVDDDVMSVLRQEAARERAARHKETRTPQDTTADSPDQSVTPPTHTTAPPATSTPETLASQTPAPDRPASSDGSLPAGGAEETARIAAAAALAMRQAKRRDSLPDIDEINSTLDPRMPDRAHEYDAHTSPRTKPKGGFWIGFSTLALLSAVAVGLYVQAPNVILRVPDAQIAIERYTSTVNTARLWLDQMLVNRTD